MALSVIYSLTVVFKIYLLERESECVREREKIYPLVHFPGSSNSLSWARSTLGARNSVQVSCVGVRDPVSELYLLCLRLCVSGKLEPGREPGPKPGHSDTR